MRLRRPSLSPMGHQTVTVTSLYPTLSSYGTSVRTLWLLVLVQRWIKRNFRSVHMPRYITHMRNWNCLFNDACKFWYQWVPRDYISRLQNSLFLFISNGTAKTKLAKLAFLYCGEFAKTSFVLLQLNVKVCIPSFTRSFTWHFSKIQQITLPWAWNVHGDFHSFFVQLLV